MPVHSRIVLVLAALLATSPALAQDATRRAPVIWQDRGDAAGLDLTTGPGGADHEPGTVFRFLQESASGTSAKFDVEDERGVRWKIKLGEEGRGETAAARLLWAAGYLVDEDYYRLQIHVSGMPPLKRGQRFVAPDGTVAGARLERHGPDTTPWSWYDNPFIGSREFNGLRVMMALINNWDLKAVNNGVTGASTGEGVYGITDLGASFGRTGNTIHRSKGRSQDFAATTFIDKVTATHVDFVLESRPFLPTVVHVRNYVFRTRMESIAHDIPIADARWIGDRLGRLSATQIADCFRAGGFSPPDVDVYTRALLKRISALRALQPVTPAAAADHAELTEDLAADTTTSAPLSPGSPAR
jgi:hypothetical protein